jgi:uncharacterized protein YcbX
VRLDRYPVKSMLGETLDQADVDAGGLLGDRVYAVVDRSDGSIASAKNPRRWGALFSFRAAFVDTPLADRPPPPVEITFASGSSVRSDDLSVHDALSAALGRPVELVSGSHAVRSMPYQATTEDGEVKDEIKQGNIGRLAPPDRFYDLTPVHVVTLDTLRAPRELEPSGDFDVRRFRPNIVLDANRGGFVENGWVGKTIHTGTLEIKVVMLTGRCVITTLAQRDLPANRAHLRAVARHNRHSVPPYGVMGCAGVYGSVEHGGIVRVGGTATIE